ncbi:MAG TPA: hypothetical protein VIZ28_14075 [Chitinophagaceae bacterium]
MKQTLLFLCATIFTASAALSQTKREIMEEDPKLSPNLRFELSPLDFKTSPPYNFAGASLRASYRMNNKFSIAGEFRKEYWDYEETDLQNISSGYLYGNPEPVAGWGAELTGTFYFKAVEKEAEQWMPVKSRSTGYRTVEVTIDPVPTTKLMLYGLRGGYAMDRATSQFEAEISEVGNPSNIGSGTVIALETRNFFFGGLSMTRIKNVKVKYPTYGTRRKQVYREIYADVLFGGEPKADNVVNYDGSGNATYYQVDKYAIDKKVGWRVGVNSTPTGRMVNVGYGLELASMPGGSFGINVKLIFSLFAKAGLSEE